MSQTDSSQPGEFDDSIENEEFVDEFEDELEDEEYDEDELYYDDDDDEEKEESSGSRKKKRRAIRLTCFYCNRKEGFYSAYRHYWLYSYFEGFTFGLINLFGPFRCRCCGRKRVIRSDAFHPRVWFRKPQTNSRVT